MRIAIITGEASGDMYGSLLAVEIKRLDPAVQLTGVGGAAMRNCGVSIFLDSNEISVVGIWEAIVRLNCLRKAMASIKSQIRRLKPDLLILIDYPGMNLRLARFAARMGIKVMYYISPQVWAWGRGRIGTIRDCVDKMVVVLPFEREIYRQAGVDVTYVGHPLIDIVKTSQDRESFLRESGLGTLGKLVSLLPGSRPQEIGQHLGPLVETASLLRRRRPDMGFVMVTLPEFEAMVRAEIDRTGQRIAVVTAKRYDAIAHSDLAITCSGTVTLEAALLGTPMIVIYKLALFSWVLGRLIVKVPYISLVNLVAREAVVPEFVQGAVKPAVLADEAVRILEDESRRRRMIQRLEQVRTQLGQGDATRKAAEIALSLAQQ